MAKNYADIYNSNNFSIALEQRFYLKKESTRGVMVAPQDTDFFLHLPGGQISYEQPIESSPQRSGRHHNNIIKKKKVSAFNFSTYFNIDQAAINGKTSIDTPVKALWESLLGNEDVSGADAIYDPSVTPDVSFTLMEIGDKWARQSPGGFIQGGNIQLVGDGEATVEWTGNAKTTYFIGIGKSVIDNNAGNTITVGLDEGKNFQAGGMVMIVEADGVTRSADTAAGTARKIVSVVGDVITIDGAVLADADGSVTPIYLCYYEPAAPTAIDDPQTGLVGSITIASLPSQCIRSLGIDIQNNHELVDYCFGEDGLGGLLFVPGDRLTAAVTLSLNLGKDLVGFFNGIQSFEAQDIEAVLGDVAARYFQVLVPKVFFQVPAFSVPDTGSIPVEFSGTAYQTALDAADELIAKFR